MAFGLYIHFPFCRHQSAYRDFNAVRYDPGLEKLFYEALTIETDLVAQAYRDYDNQIGTVYIGGGTPSLTNLELFRNWLEQVRQLFAAGERVEFSFEISPESCSRELLQALLEFGVNRPVFGVQSFDARLLKLLGRKHTVHQVHEAIYYANALGFENYGCDLLYGLPGQTAKKLSDDLDQMTDLDPPHVSFNQLRIEPGTKLAEMIDLGNTKKPDQDFVRKLYQAGSEHFTEHGYERYEDGLFAKPPHECRYDMNVSNGGYFVGLGPSARSLMNGKRYANVANLHEYLNVLKSGRRPIIENR